ncbi:MAG: DUF3784 domain-containing protein [Eubacteriales bacterium]|nr:DUF3784 domain-containing protein [Eubacteriales bacterium]
MWVIFLMTASFAGLAVVFFMGKGAFLIAGYNTSSREERAKYDEKKLCRTMGMVCAVIAVMTALMALWHTAVYAAVYGAVLLGVVGWALYWANVKCKRPPEAAKPAEAHPSPHPDDK